MCSVGQKNVKNASHASLMKSIRQREYKRVINELGVFFVVLPMNSSYLEIQIDKIATQLFLHLA